MWAGSTGSILPMPRGRSLTLRSEKQYLYLWEDGVFTLLDSVWDGSTHTLQTAELGCYVLTDTPL